MTSILPHCAVIDLDFLLPGYLCDPIGTGEKAIEMVEAAVLCVDHNDNIDL
jgi:hypothetical protein